MLPLLLPSRVGEEEDMTKTKLVACLCTFEKGESGDSVRERARPGREAVAKICLPSLPKKNKLLHFGAPCLLYKWGERLPYSICYRLLLRKDGVTAFGLCSSGWLTPNLMPFKVYFITSCLPFIVFSSLLLLLLLYSNHAVPC